jgi:ATP-dependent DNA helicase RecG
VTDTELAEIVANLRAAGTDHSKVEAKAAATELPKRLWETLSAFANTPGGGVIVLGLDERKRFMAIGVRDQKKIQQDVASLCDQMEPPLRSHIRSHALEGVHVVVVEVPEMDRAQKPCFYKGQGHLNGSFVRVADGDRKLTSYEVQLMIAGRGQPRDDEEPVLAASRADLDDDRVGIFLRRVREHSRNLVARSDDEILTALKAMVPSGENLVPSLAGLLAFGRHPQQVFPGLYCQFVVYPAADVGVPGPSSERFLDNRRLEGAAPVVVEQALTALRHHMAQKTLIRGSRREDAWMYPETALREAIVNALVHRDLSSASRGTPVQIQMFPDRLVVMNPGGLFGPVTLDRLGEAGVSAARNATLMRILEDAPGPDGVPICENRGSGIGAMIHALHRAGLEPPRFEDSVATFRVTFPNASLLDKETLAWLERLGVSLSETQRLGLALLRRGHVLDNTLYRQTSGLDSRVATRELGDMVAMGLIEQIGTRHWATYRLASKATRRRNRRAEIISVLRRRGDLSRDEIAQELELSGGAVRQWLTILRKEGLVEMTGPARSPTVRYRLIPKRKRR